MPRILALSVIGGFLLLFLASNALFTVSQINQAIVLQFGAIQRQVQEPGLHFKVPFIEQVIFLDRRALNLDMDPQEVLATDKQRLVVDAFARFRIVDPLKTYQTVRSEDGLQSRLAGILASRIRDALGQQPFNAMLSPERGELMDRIQAEVNRDAAQLGAEIIDVRIMRADLPIGDPLNATFERMRSERLQEARGIRAQGQKQAELIRAEADSEAARIYAESFGKDADFFAFYRSMLAYRQTMTKEDTTVVLSPDSAFMRPFQSAQ
jgi:membrane protease subunit HflC